MGWFRLHERVLNDPKLAKLPDALCWQWVKVLCLASKYKGCLPHDLRDVAYELRISERKARSILDDLVKASLLDEGEDQILRPHDWEDWQYIAEQRHAESHRNKREEAGLPRNRWINPKVRQSVFERDGYKCKHCGSTENLTIDHIISELKGGTNEVENLQTLCRACNARKRDFPDEFFNPQATHKELISTRTEQIQNRTDTEHKTQELLAIELLPDWVPVKAFEAFVEMRRKIRKPLTEDAKKLAIKKLGRLREQGHDPEAVLNESILGSYQGLFPPKQEQQSDKQTSKAERRNAHISETTRRVFDPSGQTPGDIPKSLSARSSS